MSPSSPPTDFCDLMPNECLSEYLNNLGPMSRLPTPPMEDSRPSFNSLYHEEHIYNNQRMLKGVARRLSHVNEQACAQATPTSTVTQYLEDAHLSLGSIALTYNILANYKASAAQHKRHDSAGPDMLEAINQSDGSTPPELMFLAALQLAASFMDDDLAKLSFWTETVAKGSFQPEELWHTSAEMIANIGEQLPVLGSPTEINAALERLPVKGLALPAAPRFGQLFREQQNVLPVTPLSMSGSDAEDIDEITEIAPGSEWLPSYFDA